jgi:hypothetical protein
MDKQTIIGKIRKACIEAKPEIESRLTDTEFGVIHFAEVLLALQTKFFGTKPWPPFKIEASEQYLGYAYFKSDTAYHHRFWNLRDDTLEHQSEETLSFIASLLYQPPKELLTSSDS